MITEQIYIFFFTLAFISTPVQAEEPGKKISDNQTTTDHILQKSITNDSIRYSVFRVKADNLQFDTVNSYPQRVIEIVSQKKPYNLIVTTFATYDDESIRTAIELKPYKRDTHYSIDVEKYLKPTALIESESPEITAIARSLIQDEYFVFKIIENTLNWVSDSIAFDQELAQKISAGESCTQSASLTLKRRKGTCSEFTNVFIAIMRNARIPSRFVCGVVLDGGKMMYHAWAECYIEDIGWVGVDPQNAMKWLPDCAIKLFVGLDFVDCRINLLPDINAELERIK